MSIIKQYIQYFQGYFNHARLSRSSFGEKYVFKYTLKMLTALFLEGNNHEYLEHCNDITLAKRNTNRGMLQGSGYF